ncbi:trimeric intracellular cation channel family protein [Rhizobium sp. TRM95796]|uniref:trimeric intracellular cation channel family protein n=1 Tax=Rhizobium sp. TRM95796 TaxID=2979862 RepID=UPI0021E77CCE|nr:trimeric intracellular cation channel family protein [Rhizobium sp. TRM95796]MCV3766910.1 trimeric intracellular cation channel family protein [Rhizobium sp. TRM95796]
MSILEFLDYLAIAVFAATGALSASRKQLDIVGFIFLAALTGIGGGTFRDVILGQLPVFWVRNPNYMLVCLGSGILVYFTAHLLESRYKLLLWLDAIGLSAYAALGAAKGLAATGSPVVAIVTGMLTSAFGGVLRDIVAGEPSVLLRPEIYISAALAGAAVFTGASALGMSQLSCFAAAMATCLVIRGGALVFGWTFPVYRARPGRNPNDIL